MMIGISQNEFVLMASISGMLRMRLCGIRYQLLLRDHIHLSIGRPLEQVSLVSIADMDVQSGSRSLSILDM